MRKALGRASARGEGVSWWSGSLVGLEVGSVGNGFCVVISVPIREVGNSLLTRR